VKRIKASETHDTDEVIPRKKRVPSNMAPAAAAQSWRQGERSSSSQSNSVLFPISECEHVFGDEGAAQSSPAKNSGLTHPLTPNQLLAFAHMAPSRMSQAALQDYSDGLREPPGTLFPPLTVGVGASNEGTGVWEVDRFRGGGTWSKNKQTGRWNNLPEENTDIHPGQCSLTEFGALAHSHTNTEEAAPGPPVIREGDAAAASVETSNPASTIKSPHQAQAPHLESSDRDQGIVSKAHRNFLGDGLVSLRRVAGTWQLGDDKVPHPGQVAGVENHSSAPRCHSSVGIIDEWQSDIGIFDTLEVSHMSEEDWRSWLRGSL
jgi:hypothetical protein